MTVAAAIDIGSNSVHLLLAELDDAGVHATHIDENLQLGLGAVVDRQGRLGAAARREATAAVDGYAARARAAGASRVLLLGTEPVRRAADRSELQREIRDRLDLELVVLSHDQEAALTLLGVTQGRAGPEALVVMDVGGGSTEVILVAPDADPVFGAFPVGSARLSSVVVEHDPPTTLELAELQRAAAGLAGSLPMGTPVRGVVSGGSGTNVSRLLGRPRTTALDHPTLVEALDLLQTRPAAELAAATELTERRVRQLAAGICIVDALMQRYGLRLVEASDAGLREGALLAAGRDGDDWLRAIPGPARPQTQPARRPTDRAR